MHNIIYEMKWNSNNERENKENESTQKFQLIVRIHLFVTVLVERGGDGEADVSIAAMHVSCVSIAVLAERTRNVLFQ